MTNDFDGLEGYVLYLHNHSTSFVNGSDWKYSEAIVSCRQLGMLNIFHIELVYLPS